jgi:hypothetical protein
LYFSPSSLPSKLDILSKFLPTGSCSSLSFKGHHCNAFVIHFWIQITYL